MQAELIKSDMFNCRSPSAVLLSRIEKLKATWAHTGAPGRPVAPTVAPRRPIAVSRVQPTVAPVSMTMRGSAARSRSPRGRDGVPHPSLPPRKEQTWNDMSGPFCQFFFVGNDDVGLVGEKEKNNSSSVSQCDLVLGVGD